MRHLLLFALALSVLSPACTTGPACEATLGLSSAYLRFPPGVPVDADAFSTTYEGSVEVTVVDGALPPGLHFEGMRLLGTATEEGTFTAMVDVTPTDPAVCAAMETVTVLIEAVQCISEEACHARVGGTEPCTRSADCAPFGGLEGHCVAITETEGRCLLRDLGCGAGTTAREFTDVEGTTFTSCGALEALSCEAPGYCT